MRSRRNSGDQLTPIGDLYAMKIASLWRALRHEHAALWMLCFYFFFEYVRLHRTYPVLDILPWAQICMLGTIAFAFIDRNSRWVNHHVNIQISLFGVILIVSGLLAFRPAASLDYWDVFGSWYIVYFLMLCIVNTEQRLILFLIAYCLFSLKMAQHGAIGWASRGFSFASYGLIGAPGWFRNSGEYAVQMLIFGSLAISMVVGLREHWPKYKRWFLYACAATGFMAVMGASSRGSQIALAVMVIWLLLKQEGGLRGLVVMAVLAVGLFYLLPEEQIQRFREMGTDINSLQRLTYWNYALNHVIPEHFWSGVGYHNWTTYVWFKNPDGMGPLRIVQESHNILIQAQSELGVFGLISFLVLAFSSFRINRKTRMMARELDKPFLSSVSFGLDAGMLGFLVAGMFVTILYYPFFWIQLSMIVVLSNVTKVLHEKKYGKRRRSRRRPAESAD